MPIYEYLCVSCNHKFDEYLVVDSPNPLCPECSNETKKLISRVLGIVKGSEHRLLDCVVGEDADKKRAILEKRKQKRILQESKKGG